MTFENVTVDSAASAPGAVLPVLAATGLTGAANAPQGDVKPNGPVGP